WKADQVPDCFNSPREWQLWHAQQEATAQPATYRGLPCVDCWPSMQRAMLLAGRCANSHLAVPIEDVAEADPTVEPPELALDTAFAPKRKPARRPRAP